MKQLMIMYTVLFAVAQCITCATVYGDEYAHEPSSSGKTKEAVNLDLAEVPGINTMSSEQGR